MGKTKEACAKINKHQMGGAVSKVIAATALPLLGGLISTKLSNSSEALQPGGWYDSLKKPRWNPPNWVFPVAWALLYPTMGYASYLVYEALGGWKNWALGLYGAQLGLNYLFAPLQFGVQDLGLALYDVSVLTVVVAAMTQQFHAADPLAGKLMVPYVVWCMFATALSSSIWVNNSGH